MKKTEPKVVEMTDKDMDYFGSAVTDGLLAEGAAQEADRLLRQQWPQVMNNFRSTLAAWLAENPERTPEKMSYPVTLAFGLKRIPGAVALGMELKFAGPKHKFAGQPVIVDTAE